MTERPRVAWFRIGAETVAIVASILLAFSIDAAWAKRQDAAREEVVLQGLLADFQDSRDELIRAIEVHESNRQRFTEFAAMTTGDVESWTPDWTFSPLVLSPLVTFDPRTATLEALQSGGGLTLVEDHRLRGLLAQWGQQLLDIEEDAKGMRGAADRVMQLTERHGGPFLDVPFLRTAGAGELLSMRADTVLMGAARTAHYKAWFYVVELRDLLDTLDEIVRSLEQSDRAA